MDLHALRYYPFKIKADSIVEQIIINSKASIPENSYSKITVDFIGNKELVEAQLNYYAQANGFIYKNLIKPYTPWLEYATPLNENNREIILTLGVHEEKKANQEVVESSDEAIYSFIGKKNVKNLLNELLGDIDLFRERNNVMFLSLKGPLSKGGLNHYNFFHSSSEKLDGVKVHEIVFFPKQADIYAFTGYLYITESYPYTLKKAIFTISNSHAMNFVKDILFTQIFDVDGNLILPKKEEYLFSMGDDSKGGLFVSKNIDFTDTIPPLTLSEKNGKYFSGSFTKNKSLWEYKNNK